jgi:hypothetical protein
MPRAGRATARWTLAVLALLGMLIGLAWPRRGRRATAEREPVAEPTPLLLVRDAADDRGGRWLEPSLAWALPLPEAGWASLAGSLPGTAVGPVDQHDVVDATVVPDARICWEVNDDQRNPHGRP